MKKTLHGPQYLLIALGVLAVFSQSIFFDFLEWDDHTLIVANPYVNPPTVNGVANAWRAPHVNLYIPLVYNLWTGIAWVSQTPSADLQGIALNSFIYHLANVLVHLANALLVYSILVLLFPRRWVAAAAALVWAVHPFQVEPVAWATGMKDLLSGTFALLATLTYLHAARRHTGDKPAARTDVMLYAAATVCMGLATLAKPGVVGVPLIAIAVDLLILRRPFRRVVVCGAPLLLAVVPSAMVTSSQQALGDAAFLTPVWTRPFIAGHALAVYLQKLIWPDHFTFQYDYAPIDVVRRGWTYAAWVVPAAVTAAILLCRTGRRVLVAAWVIFLAGVAPVLGLVPFIFQYYSTVADRYVYLSLLGAAMALAYLLNRLSVRNATVLAAVVSSILIVRSAIQTTTWADTRAFGEHAVAVNPRATVGLGLLARLEQKNAMDLSRLAQTLPTTDPRRVAAMQEAQAMARRAEQWYRQALEVRPDDITTLNNLTSLYAALGDLDQSLDMAERAAEAVERAPQGILQQGMDRKTIAMAAMNLKQYGRTIRNLQVHLKAFPEDAEANDLLQKAQELQARTTTQPAHQP